MQRGIALNDVERATGIRVQELRALEDERWDQLPGHAEARRALSAYARFLELDEEALIEDYERSRQRPGRSRPAPTRILRLAGRTSNRPPRPIALIAAGALLVVLIGIGLVAALGSGGGGEGKPVSAAEDTQREKTPTSGVAGTTTGATEVELEVKATADVWVCLVNAAGSPEVNGETLTAGESRGPFTSRRFEMTFGNGSVELTANGDPVKVPDLAEPLGFRVTPDGAARLSPGSQPSCA